VLDGYEMRRRKSSFISMGEDDEVFGLRQLDGGEMAKLIAEYE
jgi:hypothetical protein